MKNDDKDILNFMNNELRVGLKFMSERDVIIIFSIEKGDNCDILYETAD